MNEIGALRPRPICPPSSTESSGAEEVTITRHGRPVARLVPARVIDREKAAEAVRTLGEVSEQARLDGLAWSALRDEGRE